MQTPLGFIKTDGGRKASGFSGYAGDCVTRSIAILTGLPYWKVHADLSWINLTMPRTRHRVTVGIDTADHGIYVQSVLFKRYVEKLGFSWTSTMSVGSGCKVHLRADELPSGKLLVRVSKHYTAVIDGVIHDNHNPSRKGTRCVYGYWIRKV